MIPIVGFQSEALAVTASRVEVNNGFSPFLKDFVLVIEIKLSQVNIYQRIATVRHKSHQ